MFAKLYPDLIFTNDPDHAINMGIDGGSTLYSARKILELSKSPKTVLLESNNIMMQPTNNAVLLDTTSDTMMFKIANYLSVFRRDYRPVSVLYSRLKDIKDNITSARVDNNHAGEGDIAVEYRIEIVNFNSDELDMAEKWRAVISELKKRGASVILVMIPDGDPDRYLEYSFSRKLSAQYGLPFIDIKGQLSDGQLSYSDGRHLTLSSARYVSRVLSETIRHNDL
jgi:hypothetical protein